MDETPNSTTSPSLPTLPRWIKWRCGECKKYMQTGIDSPDFIVPHCKHCRQRNQSRFPSEGVLLYEQDTQATVVTEVPRGKRAFDKVLWEQFCRMLDTAQATMADGTPSKVYCRACEEAVHTSPVGCGCPCHAAWAFRREIESQMEKAA